MSIALLLGCSTAPERRLADRAAALGLGPLILGGPFQVTAFYRDGAGGRLHVYLDGDGTPWMRGRDPAPNPTPRRPLALDLLARDPAPVLYLNRPCYGTAAPPATCRPWLWTHGRYSEQVVGALDAALDRAIAVTGHGPVVLLGYSGGGSLAVLLAARRRDVEAVVTVAANLDVDAWTRHHGYEPLTGSLNPAAARPAPATVLRWHLLGGRDRRVPPAVTRAGAAGDPRARLLEYPDFDHVCCWQQAWPGILDRLRERLDPPRRPEADHGAWRVPAEMQAPRSRHGASLRPVAPRCEARVGRLLPAADIPARGASGPAPFPPLPQPLARGEAARGATAGQAPGA